VVKKKGINMAALEVDQQEDAKEAEFAKGANLVERGNVNKGDRPAVEDKANKPMVVYFTQAEKEKMKAYCRQISFSALVKQMLNEKGIL
jgi:hypothetical protein